jgi:glycosyltransferase involved in cell wall biosynthesis
VTNGIPPGERLLVIVPAYNEEEAIAGVVKEVNSVLGDVPVLVIDDCSTDGTRSAAQSTGAQILPLPHHLGLGGSVQAGYKLAFELGFDYVIRVDGDGQHDPRCIPVILERLKASGCQMVIGSRYLHGKGEGYTSAARGIGIQLFRAILKPILGKDVSDPTSGFVGVNREALALFSRSFPLEYPEIEALVVLQRKRFRFEEVPCVFRPRRTGRSSITGVKSLRYMVHVLLGVFVNILRIRR